MMEYHQMPDIFQPPHHEDSYDDARQRRRVDWLVDNSEGTVLELGCSEGYILSQINRPGCCGVDYDQDRVREGKKKYPDVKFYVLDIRYGLPFPDGYFDTVLAPEVLEHVDFDEAVYVLGEAVRVCRHRVLITLPYAGGEDFDPKLVHTPDHKWIPNVQSVSKLLDEAARGEPEYDMTLDSGFALIEVRKMQSDAK